MQRLGILIGFFVLALGAGTGTGWASPILVIQQGANPAVTVNSSLDGLVQLNGTVGTYDINGTVGFSSATLYEIDMDLNSIDATIKNGFADPVGGPLNATDFQFSNRIRSIEAGPSSLFSQGTFDIGQFTSGARTISFDQALLVPVPEPISLTLLGSGLVGLAAMRRRGLGQDLA